MKRLLGVFFSVLVGVFLFAPAAYAESVNIYAPYDSFEDMRDAYVEAIENGDTEKQEELYELGHSTLRAEIEMSKKAFNEESMTRAKIKPQWNLEPGKPTSDPFNCN